MAGNGYKKIQPDRLNSSGDIALDNKGTFGLERGTIGLERQKIFLHYDPGFLKVGPRLLVMLLLYFCKILKLLPDEP